MNLILINFSESYNITQYINQIIPSSIMIRHSFIIASSLRFMNQTLNIKFANRLLSLQKINKSSRQLYVPCLFSCYNSLMPLIYTMNRSCFCFCTHKEINRLKQKVKIIKQGKGVQSDEYLQELQRLLHAYQDQPSCQMQQALSCAEQITNLFVIKYKRDSNMSQEQHQLYQSSFAQIIQWLHNSQQIKQAIQAMKKLMQIQEKRYGSSHLKILQLYDQMLNIYSQQQPQTFSYEEIMQLQKKIITIASIHHEVNQGQDQNQLLDYKFSLFSKMIPQFLINEDKETLIFTLEKFDQFLSYKSFKEHDFDSQKTLIQNKTLCSFTYFRIYKLSKALQKAEKALQLLEMMDSSKNRQFVIDKRFQIALNFMYIYTLKCQFNLAERFLKKCKELMSEIVERRYQRLYSINTVQKTIKKRKKLPHNIIQIELKINELQDIQGKLDHYKLQQEFFKIAEQFKLLKGFPFYYYQQLKYYSYAYQHAKAYQQSLTVQNKDQDKNKGNMNGNNNNQQIIANIQQRAKQYITKIMNIYLQITDVKEKTILIDGTQEVMEFPDFADLVQMIEISKGCIELFNFVGSNQQNIPQSMNKTLSDYMQILKALKNIEEPGADQVN